jgi:hypothetical protein
MGTGVGEAALIGAAVGGGTALLTGNDPLRGALLGGVTGGAGSKLNTMFNTTAPAAVPATTSTATSTGTNLADALNATQVAPTAVNTGIAGAIPNSGMAAGMGPGGLPEIGMNLNKAVNDVGLLGNFGGYDNLAFNRALAPQFTTSAAQTMPQAVQASQTMYPSLSDDAAKAFFESDMGLDRAYLAGQPPPPKPGFFGDMMNKYSKLGPAGQIGVGIGGGVALNALAGGMKPQGIETEDEEENPMGLATYKREKYQAINPLRHNVYRPVYGAEGGIMQGYAQGGIAALAAEGMGGNTGYPMGQMDMTQYATPTQMPTSAQVVNADYAQKTDPYMGTPIGMATGGTAEDEYEYDMSSLGGFTMADLAAGSRGVRRKKAAPPKPDAVKAYEAYINQTAVPTVYNSGYQDYVSGTPMVTTPEAFDQAPNFMDAYNLLAATAPNIASTISPGALAASTGAPATSGTAGGMASGGIAGYNLGGYASGGNPRLLKGPGDGMSDNIPATIGGRQPARLADGEFVVPADVVSHLGNGSTDAGAKHLYNMMDKVRKARTGNKKQGKQIKPGKFLPK